MDIVGLGGPVRVSQRMETSLFFSLFVVSVLLLFGQTLPLGGDNHTLLLLAPTMLLTRGG